MIVGCDFDLCMVSGLVVVVCVVDVVVWLLSVSMMLSRFCFPVLGSNRYIRLCSNSLSTYI